MDGTVLTSSDVKATLRYNELAYIEEPISYLIRYDIGAGFTPGFGCSLAALARIRFLDFIRTIYQRFWVETGSF